jgi:hypothetical protein
MFCRKSGTWCAISRPRLWASFCSLQSCSLSSPFAVASSVMRVPDGKASQLMTTHTDCNIVAQDILPGHTLEEVRSSILGPAGSTVRCVIVIGAIRFLVIIASPPASRGSFQRYDWYRSLAAECLSADLGGSMARVPAMSSTSMMSSWNAGGLVRHVLCVSSAVVDGACIERQRVRVRALAEATAASFIESFLNITGVADLRSTDNAGLLIHYHHARITCIGVMLMCQPTRLVRS